MENFRKEIAADKNQHIVNESSNYGVSQQPIVCIDLSHDSDDEPDTEAQRSSNEELLNVLKVGTCDVFDELSNSTTETIPYNDDAIDDIDIYKEMKLEIAASATKDQEAFISSPEIQRIEIIDLIDDDSETSIHDSPTPQPSPTRVEENNESIEIIDLVDDESETDENINTDDTRKDHVSDEEIENYGKQCNDTDSDMRLEKWLLSKNEANQRRRRIQVVSPLPLKKRRSSKTANSAPDMKQTSSSAPLSPQTNKTSLVRTNNKPSTSKPTITQRKKQATCQQEQQNSKQKRPEVATATTTANLESLQHQMQKSHISKVPFEQPSTSKSRNMPQTPQLKEALKACQQLSNQMIRKSAEEARAKTAPKKLRFEDFEKSFEESERLQQKLNSYMKNLKNKK